MCEEVFDNLEISKDDFLDSQARYTMDESTRYQVTDAMQTGQVSKETLKLKPSLAQSMQLQVDAIKPARPLQKSEVEQCLKQSRDVYVRQKTQGVQNMRAEAKENPTTLEEIIFDLVCQAKANDEMHVSSNVSEEDLEQAVLYYNMVQGESLSIKSNK